MMKFEIRYLPEYAQWKLIQSNGTQWTIKPDFSNFLSQMQEALKNESKLLNFLADTIKDTN